MQSDGDGLPITTENRPSSDLWTQITSNILIGLASFALIGLTLVVTFDVISRSVFNAPTLWAYEVCKYLLAISVLFGAAHTMALGQMIRVDIIYNYLSEPVRNRLDIIGALCGFIFSSVLVYVSAILSWETYKSGSTSLDLDIPVYLSQALVPIAALTLAVQCLVQMFKAIKAVTAQGK